MKLYEYVETCIMCLSDMLESNMEASSTNVGRTKWVYAMVRLVDVGSGKMRMGTDLRSVMKALEDHPDIYNLFNMINTEREPVHILCGKSISISGKIDICFMIGIKVRSDMCVGDMRYSYLFGQEIDRYLGKSESGGFGLDWRKCKLFVENPEGEAQEFVLWCMEIVNDMDEVLESGVSLLL